MEYRDYFLLEEIVGYCDRIAQTIAKNGGDFSRYENDIDFQEVCSFRAIQIGELVNKLSDSVKGTHPEIPWHLAVGLRNLLTHDYGNVDNVRMWNTLIEDYPKFREACARLVQ
ncbi:DUF86 domain-containing protein [Candidatus Saccharibacteria bacterium]|nr:DUF86 domain-containing protein [Candidatus Saccharibacteria bacterium]